MKNRHFSWDARRGLLVAGALGASAAGLAFHAAPAQACGGFFCSQAAPVEQAAEEIIFVDNPDDTVTAVIRIQYQGPAEQFAWVLPIAGTPADVGVSSNVAFDSLRRFSDPQYVLNTTVEGECRDGGFNNGFPSMGPGASVDAGSEDASGVGVVAQGSVGPYDWHVISVDAQLPDPADAAVDWLVGNGYDVTALGPDVLRPYLESGLNLMAFKLTKGADVNTGSIRPVVLTYESDVPAIPIRPTAVAAQNDMGILVWVLGDEQAVPSNYKSLLVNEALINWFGYQQNYRQVVTEAANQAGGQGFVTEMAGSTVQLDQSVFSDGAEAQWMQYSLTSFADGFDMISQASGQFSGWDGWRDAVCGAVTLPDGVTCVEFGQMPEQYRGTVQIDQELFIRTLYEDVVKPVIETQQLLLSRPYFTRLFSTMSADEMTVDPAFDFNPDLADVSNVHTAEHVIECSPDVTSWEAPWRIELPQGGVIRGEGQQGSWPIALDDLPANWKIVQLGTSGPGLIVQDNQDEIGKALFAQSGMNGTGMATPEPPKVGVPIGGGGNMMPGGEPGTGSGGEPVPGGGAGPGLTGTDSVETGDGDGFCSVTHAGARGGTSAAWLLFLIATAGVVARAGRRRA